MIRSDSRSLRLATFAALALSALLATHAALAQVPNKINYQGRLTNAGGTPVTASVTMVFKLYTVASGGAAIYTETQTVSVSNGIFNVAIGSVTALNLPFDVPYYLGVAVGADAEMNPRQAVLSSPYSLNVGSSHAYVQGGNAFGALPGSTALLGTTDSNNNALDVLVKNGRVMRYEASAISPNVIGGSPANGVSSGVRGATIGGGGVAPGSTDPDFGFEAPNVVTDAYGTVAGGYANRAGDNAGTAIDSPFVTVGGGAFNTAAASYATVGGGGANQALGQYALVGGGEGNLAQFGHGTVAGGGSNTAMSDFSTVGGGDTNSAGTSQVIGVASTVAGGSHNIASANRTTVGGGDQNKATGGGGTVAGGISNQAAGVESAVGGGSSNFASGAHATIGGGHSNQTSNTGATVGGGDGNYASGINATVGGGASNTANGLYSTIPGGSQNLTNQNYAFAAGYRAKALNGGCFTWADANDFDFNCVIFNAFTARATGGVYFVTAIDGVGNATAGVQLPAGSGAWSALSDRAAKRDLAVVDGREVLAKLAEVPVYTWRYKTEVSGALHLGPVAQDFSAAFGLGDGDKTISTVDADGVALAAIQGLNAKLEEQAAALRERDARIDAQAARIAELERDRLAQVARLDAMERRTQELVAQQARLWQTQSSGSVLGLAALGAATPPR